MRAGGIAVPVPTESLKLVPIRRLDRSGKASRAELVSLPRIEGLPALVWAWKTGQQYEGVTMERLPN